MSVQYTAQQLQAIYDRAIYKPYSVDTIPTDEEIPEGMTIQVSGFIQKICNSTFLFRYQKYTELRSVGTPHDKAIQLTIHSTQDDILSASVYVGGLS
jgi:hypothetical protein